MQSPSRQISHINFISGTTNIFNQQSSQQFTTDGHGNMMQHPPSQQQLFQQLSASHINFVNGTTNIFNQQPLRQIPQQSAPAGHVNRMQPSQNQQQLLRQQFSAEQINLINGTINIYQQQTPAENANMIQEFIAGTTGIFS
ncbi:8938_t:CDS:1 [Ambispora leptoticha]|uniref:8938_t:CDS:1 n=1 Tax=Ambispora leptoticha TaxID=144679 RepID=A0A9N9H0A8_9GLOM|nr:8938_t:CDS:1 [Ambispora leptoticha]